MYYSKTLALILGATFFLVGLIGFVPNPIVHAEGIFVTNAMHNFVHIATGSAFMLALLVPGREALLLKVVGVGYLLVAILGFFTSGNYLLGVVEINMADRWLHSFLAVAILVAGGIASHLDTNRLSEHAN